LRTVVHLSDLHFGRIEPGTVSALLSTLREQAPDVLVVSGDFTQRASKAEFSEARAFLDQIAIPQVLIPGNHDVPLYDVFSRFVRPLDRYRRYIAEDLQPFYADAEIAIAGVNTARSLTFKGGRINHRQVAALADRLCPLTGLVKIVVTHHPFDLPDGYPDRDLLARARMAMEKMAECGADVFLSGHLHVSHTGQTARRYRIHNHSALVVQAGTATSSRGRGEANSFNILRVEQSTVAVERWTFELGPGNFVLGQKLHFARTAGGWVESDPYRSNVSPL
jgi:3',5'-cyclic AMP phosphodiesterase CpdA